MANGFQVSHLILSTVPKKGKSISANLLRNFVSNDKAAKFQCISTVLMSVNFVSYVLN